MDVTYYFALPFTFSEDGITPGEVMECPSNKTRLTTRRIPSSPNAGSWSVAIDCNVATRRSASNHCV